jgi:hypothetical protein
MMDQWPAYQQVLTLSNPPIETITAPGDTPELARVANDELRKICEAQPDKFPIRCGLDFFGADRVLFATDCPFDPEGGPMFIR